MLRSNATPRSAGFTLVELIIVMMLLATVTALSLPALSRSMRQRYLSGEAARFLALTEFARDEAVSQGVPTVVWIDPAAGRYGVGPKPGFMGDEQRAREFEITPDVEFEADAVPTKNGIAQVVEFAADGTADDSSIESLRIVDRFASALTIARTANRDGYEILKEQP